MSNRTEPKIGFTTSRSHGTKGALPVVPQAAGFRALEKAKAIFGIGQRPHRPDDEAGGEAGPSSPVESNLPEPPLYDDNPATEAAPDWARLRSLGPRETLELLKQGTDHGNEPGYAATNLQQDDGPQGQARVASGHSTLPIHRRSYSASAQPTRSFSRTSDAASSSPSPTTHSRPPSLLDSRRLPSPDPFPPFRDADDVESELNPSQSLERAKLPEMDKSRTGKGPLPNAMLRYGASASRRFSFASACSSDGEFDRPPSTNLTGSDFNGLSRTNSAASMGWTPESDSQLMLPPPLPSHVRGGTPSFPGTTPPPEDTPFGRPASRPSRHTKAFESWSGFTSAPIDTAGERGSTHRKSASTSTPSTTLSPSPVRVVHPRPAFIPVEKSDSSPSSPVSDALPPHSLQASRRDRSADPFPAVTNPRPSPRPRPPFEHHRSESDIASLRSVPDWTPPYRGKGKAVTRPEPGSLWISGRSGGVAMTHGRTVSDTTGQLRDTRDHSPAPSTRSNDPRARTPPSPPSPEPSKRTRTRTILAGHDESHDALPYNDSADYTGIDDTNANSSQASSSTITNQVSSERGPGSQLQENSGGLRIAVPASRRQGTLHHPPQPTAGPSRAPMGSSAANSATPTSQRVSPVPETTVPRKTYCKEVDVTDINGVTQHKFKCILPLRSKDDQPCGRIVDTKDNWNHHFNRHKYEWPNPVYCAVCGDKPPWYDSTALFHHITKSTKSKKHGLKHMWLEETCRKECGVGTKWYDYAAQHYAELKGRIRAAMLRGAGPHNPVGVAA